MGYVLLSSDRLFGDVCSCFYAETLVTFPTAHDVVVFIPFAELVSFG